MELGCTGGMEQAGGHGDVSRALYEPGGVKGGLPGKGRIGAAAGRLWAGAAGWDRGRNAAPAGAAAPGRTARAAQTPCRGAGRVARCWGRGVGPAQGSFQRPHNPQGPPVLLRTSVPWQSPAQRPPLVLALPNSSSCPAPGSPSSSAAVTPWACRCLLPPSLGVKPPSCPRGAPQGWGQGAAGGPLPTRVPARGRDGDNSGGCDGGGRGVAAPGADFGAHPCRYLDQLLRPHLPVHLQASDLGDAGAQAPVLPWGGERSR